MTAPAKPDPLGVFRYTLTVYGVDLPIADADTALRISMEMHKGIGMTLSLKREWVEDAACPLCRGVDPALDAARGGE